MTRSAQSLFAVAGASLLLFILVPSCGGGTGSTHTMPDLAEVPDLTVGPDIATPPDLKAAPSDGPKMECFTPADCGGKPCCLTVQSQALQGLVCTTTADSCNPSLDITGSGQTRTCTTDTDCTSGLTRSILPTCCMATRNGQSIQMCFSTGLAQLSGGAVVCP